MDSGSFYKNAKSRPFQTVFIFTQNNKKPLIHKGFISKLPAGLEPATYALRMRCSTN